MKLMTFFTIGLVTFSSVTVNLATELQQVITNSKGVNSSVKELNALLGKTTYEAKKTSLTAKGANTLWGKKILSSDGMITEGKISQLNFIIGNEKMAFDTLKTTFKEWKSLIDSKLESKGHSMKRVSNELGNRSGYSWTLDGGDKVILHATLKKSGETFQSHQLAVSLVKKEKLKAFGAYYTSLTAESLTVKQVIALKPDAVSKALAKDLVSLAKGKLVTSKITKSPKHYVLYYSAYWCPPCRMMAPGSVKKFNTYIKNSKKIELILTSVDNSDSDLIKWANQENFPWLMIKPANVRSNALTKKYSPRSYPRMVILDKNGKQISEGHPKDLWDEVIKLSK